METISRTQIAVRLRPDILERVRYKARQEKLSVNAYIEKTLQDAYLAKIPKLPEDFVADPVIESFNGMIKAPSQKELDADPRLRHIFGV